jgi:uncharacterized membrane protein
MSQPQASRSVTVTHTGVDQRARVHTPTLAGLRLAAISPATWFLIIAVPVGLFLTVVVPPFQGLDEANHFKRVYAISGGTVVQPIRDGRAGALVPACLVEWSAGLYDEGTRPVPFQFRDYATLPAGCASRPPVFSYIENTAVYSPVSYLFQTVGVSLARSAGASLPMIFYSGRLTGLLGFLGLVFLALRLAPRGQAAILAVALLPMTLLLGAEYSGDGLTIAASLLLVALVLRCCFDPGATWRDFALAAVAALAVALSKNAYGLLALLLLLPPARLFPSERLSLAVKGGAILAIALIAGAWYLQVRNVSFAAYAPPGVIDAAAQVRLILHHPFWYTNFLARTLLGAGTGYYTWPGFVSWVGFSRTGSAGTPAPPPFIFVIGILVLVLAWMREAPGPYTWSAGTIVRAAVPIALLGATAVVVVTAVYANGAPVGSQVYWGIHGRYFLPLAALPMVSLAMLQPELRERRTILALLPLLLLLVSYLVVKVVNYFY